MLLLREDYEQAKKRLDNNYKYFNPQEYLRSQLKSPFMRLFARLRSIEISSLAEHNLRDQLTVKFFAHYIKGLDQIPRYQLVFLADSDYFNEEKNPEMAKFNHDQQLVVRYEINEKAHEKAHEQYVGAINKNRDRRRRVGRRIR